MSQPDGDGERERLDRAARILRELGEAGSAPLGDSGSKRSASLPPWQLPPSLDLPALRRLADSADWGQPQVGDMPPSPPTLRARAGRLLISLIRRALFWYSAQIVAFQRLVASAADEGLAVGDHFREELDRRREEIDALRRDVASVQQSCGQLARELDLERQRSSSLEAGLRALKDQSGARAAAGESQSDGA